MTSVPADSTSLTELSLPVKRPQESASPGRIALRRFLRQRSAIVGLTILSFLVILAIFAPLIAPYDPIKVLIGVEDVKKRADPCIHLLGCPADEPQHLMGTDGNVRDVFSRVVYGTRISLFIGFFAVGFAIIAGALLGAIAGYSGGWIDLVIMRIMDVLLAFPALLLALAIVAVLGPGLLNALFAIALVSIPAYARLVRSSVLSIKETEYVEASVALGGKTMHILFRRVLPNALTPLIVAGTLGIATAILEAAALSFLGFGAHDPTPEWGRMLSQERNQVFSAPHLVIFPGIMITLTVLAFNLIGDGLRDAFDPRLAQTEGRTDASDAG
jgi:peptide/nickel transport system permease protein